MRNFVIFIRIEEFSIQRIGENYNHRKLEDEASISI